MKPHWSFSPGISTAAQEDAAREREYEIASDAVFAQDEMAIVATFRTAIRPRKGETSRYAQERVAREIEQVIAKPDVQLSYYSPWVDFVEWYGPQALRTCFVKALAQPEQVVSDAVLYE